MSDPFDDHLRSGLGSSPGANADAVLSGLRPSLRRARRVQQVKSGVAGVALVAVSVGALLTVGNGRGEVQETIVAVAPEQDDAVASPTTDSSEPSVSFVESTRSADAEVPTTDASSTSSAGSSVATTAPSEPVSPSSTSTSPTSTSPSTTEGSSSMSSTEATSTTVAAGERTLESPCGSIVVSIDGDDIALLDVFPDAGFGVDEKDDGPETVEVSFEGPDGHCEVEAEVRDGALWSETSTE